MDKRKEQRLAHLLLRSYCGPVTEDTILEALRDVSTEPRYHLLRGHFHGFLGLADTKGWDVLKTLRCAFLGLKAEQKYNVLLNSDTLQSAVNLGSLQVIEYLVEGLTQDQILSLLEKKDSHGRSAFSVATEAPFEVLHTLLAFVSRETKTALIKREFSPLHCCNYICRLNGLWRNQVDMVGKRISAELSKSDEKIQALEGRCTRQVADMDSLKGQLRKLRQEETQMTQNLAEANTKVGALDLQCQQQAADVSALKDELKNQKTQQQREKAQSTLELESYKEKTETLEVTCTTQASNIDSLRAELENQKSQQAELRRENNQLVEETRRQAVKQERMERMMEEMERLLRQPICIGPEMDQEHKE